MEVIHYLILKNAKIIDCKTDNLNIYQGTLIIKDKRVKRILANIQESVDEDNAQVIDLKGKYLLPGLIDSHVHLAINGNRNPWHQLNEEKRIQFERALQNAKKSLKNGITMLRDLGDNKDVIWSLRNYFENNNNNDVGPDIKLSGNWLTKKGGHGSQVGYVVDKNSNYLKIITKKKAKNINILKIILTEGLASETKKKNQFSLSELKNIVQVAHKEGFSVSAHVQTYIGAKIAVQANIDSIEHGIFLDKYLVKSIKEKGIYLVPTLSGPYFIKERGHDFGLTNKLVKKVKKIWPKIKESFRLALENNVKIIMGSDASTPGNLHGNNLSELVLMTKLGMSPYQSLLSATRNAAEMLGEEENFGTIEEGKYADLVVFKENPLININLIRRPEMVIKKGRIVYGYKKEDCFW